MGRQRAAAPLLTAARPYLWYGVRQFCWGWADTCYCYVLCCGLARYIFFSPVLGGPQPIQPCRGSASAYSADNFTSVGSIQIRDSFTVPHPIVESSVLAYF